MRIERIRLASTGVRVRISPAGPGAILVALLAPLVLGVILASPVGSNLAAERALDRVTDASDVLASAGGALEKPPHSLDEIVALFKEDAEKPRFDGNVAGWRIATYGVLRAAGTAGRGLERMCEPLEGSATARTHLDFAIGYFPADVVVESTSEPEKWLCGTEALSVAQVYDLDTRLGDGHIWIERSIQGSRTIEIDVAADRVEAATINGLPAILVHPLDDETGLGLGRVIVIEDDAGPEFTILSLTADNGVPFAELIRMAEGVK